MYAELLEMMLHECYTKHPLLAGSPASIAILLIDQGKWQEGQAVWCQSKVIIWLGGPAHPAPA
jgi:hypothetical protein